MADGVGLGVVVGVGEGVSEGEALGVAAGVGVESGVWSGVGVAVAAGEAGGSDGLVVGSLEVGSALGPPTKVWDPPGLLATKSACVGATAASKTRIGAAMSSTRARKRRTPGGLHCQRNRPWLLRGRVGSARGSPVSERTPRYQGLSHPPAGSPSLRGTERRLARGQKLVLAVSRTHAPLVVSRIARRPGHLGRVYPG